VIVFSIRLRNKLVVGKLFPAYLILGVLKHLVPLKWLARWAWVPATALRDRAAERKLAATVARLSQLVGLPDRDCLQRSLILYRVLSRAGADPRLVIGFHRADNRVVGHAWVLVDGNAMIEPNADLLKFSPTLVFGAHGELVSEWPDPGAISMRS
jgi:hypothetical protein